MRVPFHDDEDLDEDMDEDEDDIDVVVDEDDIDEEVDKKGTNEKKQMFDRASNEGKGQLRLLQPR